MTDAAEALSSGESALDVLEAGIAPCEANSDIDIVGKGRWPNALGVMQTDAGVMDGATLQVGSVGAVENITHVFSLARLVQSKLPHVCLVGEGAKRFALEMGFTEEAEMVSELGKQDYQNWLRENNVDLSQLSKYLWPKDKDTYSFHKDTVIYLALDARGNLAAGTSTTGWPFKYPGRLGDSPICGAGFYADNRYGACACTNTGEMTIRASTARSVVLYMKKGASVREACLEAAEDLNDLQGGYLGSVSIHAIDPKGDYFVLMTEDSEQDFCIFEEGNPAFRREEVFLVPKYSAT